MSAFSILQERRKGDRDLWNFASSHEEVWKRSLSVYQCRCDSRHEAPCICFQCTRLVEIGTKFSAKAPVLYLLFSDPLVSGCQVAFDPRPLKLFLGSSSPYVAFSNSRCVSGFWRGCWVWQRRVSTDLLEILQACCCCGQMQIIYCNPILLELYLYSCLLFAFRSHCNSLLILLGYCIWGSNRCRHYRGNPDRSRTGMFASCEEYWCPRIWSLLSTDRTHLHRLPSGILQSIVPLLINHLVNPFLHPSYLVSAYPTTQLTKSSGYILATSPTSDCRKNWRAAYQTRKIERYWKDESWSPFRCGSRTESYVRELREGYSSVDSINVSLFQEYGLLHCLNQSHYCNFNIVVVCGGHRFPS